MKAVKRRQEEREGSERREKSDGFWRTHPTNWRGRAAGRDCRCSGDDRRALSRRLIDFKDLSW